MRFSTGVPLLDEKLGGGAPAGQIHLWGGVGSGVSSMGMSFLRETITRLSLPAMIVHANGHPDAAFISSAAHPDVIVACPDTGEFAIDAAYHGLLNGVKAVFIDSLPALLPKSCLLDIEGIPNAQKRLLFSGLSVLRRTAVSRGALVVLGNEGREVIGRARPRETSGLHACMSEAVEPNCWRSLFMRPVRKRAAYGLIEDIQVSALVGEEEVEVPIVPDGGVDHLTATLKALEHHRLVGRRGAWWIGSNLRLGPGLQAARGVLADNLHEAHRLLENAHG